MVPLFLSPQVLITHADVDNSFETVVTPEQILKQLAEPIDGLSTSFLRAIPSETAGFTQQGGLVLCVYK